MSMTIHFEVSDDAGLVRYMASLGFYRVNLLADAPLAPKEEQKPTVQSIVIRTNESGYTSAPTVVLGGVGATATVEVDPNATVVNLAGPARIPGQPSEGRKRRTRAEMAEDDAYFAAHPEMKAAVASISTGEERVDPSSIRYFYHPESDCLFTTNNGSDGRKGDGLCEELSREQYAALIAKKDDADEAAESAAHRTGELTTEDLRDVIGQYSQRHGIAAAQADIPKLLNGKGIHEIDKTQEALKTAIDAVRAALDGKQTPEPPDGLFGSDKPAEEVHATKDDVMEAIKSYAKKYDGQDADLSKAANVLADIPVVLEKTLGVKQIKQIPVDPVSYGKALRAINEAVSGNPFGRAVVK